MLLVKRVLNSVLFCTVLLPISCSDVNNSLMFSWIKNTSHTELATNYLNCAQTCVEVFNYLTCWNECGCMKIKIQIILETHHLLFIAVACCKYCTQNVSVCRIHPSVSDNLVVFATKLMFTMKDESQIKWKTMRALLLGSW